MTRAGLERISKVGSGSFFSVIDSVSRDSDDSSSPAFLFLSEDVVSCKTFKG